jgi:hypothetical protein
MDTNRARVIDFVAGERELHTRGEAYVDTVVLDAIDELLKLHGPSLSYPGESSENFSRRIDEMIGWGVTVTTEDGETIEGVLAGAAAEEVDDWAAIRIYPAVEEGDGGLDYLTIDEYKKRGIEARVVTAFNVEVS